MISVTKLIAIMTFGLVFISQSVVAQTKLQGVTDTEIKLGAFTYFTGDWAVYGDMNLAIKAVFDKVNAEGGIHGRKISYTLVDGAQSVPKAVEATKRLMNQVKVLGFIENSGELNSATFKMIEQKGLFDFFMGDNVSYPFAKTRFYFQPSWTIEGGNIAKLIQKNHVGKKVAFIRYNGAFAKETIDGVRKSLGTSNPIGNEEMVEYDAVNGDAQVLNIMKSGADVVVMHVDPPASSNIVKFAHQKGFKPQWILSSWNFTGTYIELAGEAAEGSIVNTVIRTLGEVDHPSIKAHNEILTKYATKVKANDGITNWGMALGQTTIEILKRAGRDLTKESLIKAAESFKDWTCDLCLVPATTGPDDHRFIEGHFAYRVKGGKFVRMDK